MRITAKASLRALLTAVLLSPAALAQPDADTVISGMQATLDSTAGAAFLVTGELLGGDGTTYQLEIEVEAMTDEQIIRLFIIQPDALADNFIIVTPTDLWNYNWLTNQIVVYDADDPQAYGPLGDGGSFELTLDFASLFDGWDSVISGTVGTAAGPAVQLDLTNRDPGANIAAAQVVALEDSHLPAEITLFTASGDTMLRIAFSDFDLAPGLTADDLLWYPPDAELVDERR